MPIWTISRCPNHTNIRRCSSPQEYQNDEKLLDIVIYSG